MDEIQRLCRTALHAGVSRGHPGSRKISDPLCSLSKAHHCRLCTADRSQWPGAAFRQYLYGKSEPEIMEYQRNGLYPHPAG